MSKHTAGPWRIQESFVNNGQRWSILFRDDSKWLASVLHNNNDESMANAKLMAAAPELLEALESLLEQTRQYGHTAEITAAEAAIAKAKGAT